MTEPLEGTKINIDADQPSAKLPETEVSPSTKPAESPPDKKPSVYWHTLIGSLLAAFITAIATVSAHAWIVPKVARHHDRLERMSQALFDARETTSSMFVYLSSLRTPRVPDERFDDLVNLKLAGAKAAGIHSSIIYLFSDPTLASQWYELLCLEPTLRKP